MEITWTRSGGIAGSATAIEGSVTLADGVARVVSGLGYQRDLTPEEIGMLRDAVRQLPQERPAFPDQLRDAYQYDIRVTGDDGHTQSLTVHGESSPGVDSLLNWIHQECGRIWTRRINKRPD